MNSPCSVPRSVSTLTLECDSVQLNIPALDAWLVSQFCPLYGYSFPVALAPKGWSMLLFPANRSVAGMYIPHSSTRVGVGCPAWLFPELECVAVDDDEDVVVVGD